MRGIAPEYIDNAGISVNGTCPRVVMMGLVSGGTGNCVPEGEFTAVESIVDAVMGLVSEGDRRLLVRTVEVLGRWGIAENMMGMEAFENVTQM